MRTAAIGLAALAIFSTPAAADLFTYDYSGNEFTEHNGLFPAQDRFTGYIVVDADQLGGKVVNRHFGTFAVPEFSFTDGDRTFNKGNVGSANFSIRTDASGEIVEWALSFGESVFRFRIANFFWYFPAHDESFISIGNIYARTTVPGAWTRRNPPPPPTVPEPATVVLIAVALLALVRH